MKKESNYKSMLNYRLLMNLVTVSLLIYGIFEMKSFLSVNFIENDTEIKRKLNRAFQGQKLQDRKVKVQQADTATTNNRNRKIIIDIEGTK